MILRSKGFLRVHKEFLLDFCFLILLFRWLGDNGEDLPDQEEREVNNDQES